MKMCLAHVLVLVIFAAGCSKGGKVVAKVGNDKVTLAAVDERLAQSPAQFRSYLNTEAGRKQFLDLIVRERLVLESARMEGYAKKDEYVKAIDEFKKENARRVRDYEEKLLLEMYATDLQKKSLKPSEADVNKYYEQHISDYNNPVEIKARHILLQDKAKAEAVLARVNSGEDFAKVAKETSEDTVSAQNGGEIGPFKKGDLVPDFEAAVFPLKMGQVSEVVKTAFGYHVIKKTQEKKLSAIPAAEAKVEIERLLEKLNFDKWVEDTKKRLNVDVDYSALTALSEESQKMQQEASGDAQPQPESAPASAPAANQ